MIFATEAQRRIPVLFFFDWTTVNVGDVISSLRLIDIRSQSPNLVIEPIDKVAERLKPEGTDMNYCGIDVASKSSDISIIDER